MLEHVETCRGFRAATLEFGRAVLASAMNDPEIPEAIRADVARKVLYEQACDLAAGFDFLDPFDVEALAGVGQRAADDLIAAWPGDVAE